MKKYLSNTIILLLITLLSVAMVHADITDLLVNDDGGNAEQNHPSIAVDALGQFVIVWTDKRNGNSDIYLQRFSQSGDLQGGNIKINDDLLTAYQAQPAVAVDFNNNYALTWIDYRNGAYPFDPSIYFQQLDSNLLLTGANLLLTTETPDTLKEYPDIDLDPSGNGVIVWADFRNKNWDIYGQRIKSDGQLLGQNFKINDDFGSSQQHAPRVAISPHGWFVVTWYDNRFTDDDIFFQRFDINGQKIGSNVKVNSDGSGNRQVFPDVAVDGQQRFTIVWVDWRNGNYPNNSDIYSRQYDTSHIALAAEHKVNRDNSTRSQKEPTIAADRLGNVVITWSDSTSSSWDIIGQMIDVDGVIREANFKANIETDSAQLQADVALDGKYRYVTWTDKRNGNFDIYTSVTQYNNPQLIPSTPLVQFSMVRFGQLPLSKNVTVDHAGYNPLTFDAVSNEAWLSVTPTNSQTPDSLTLSIMDSTLAVGIHTTQIVLYDQLNNDSSVTISVQVEVFDDRPMLKADPDSIHIITSNPENISKSIVVSNVGMNTLNWIAQSNDNWITLNSSSGSDNDTVSFSIDTSSMIYTRYTGSITVVDSNAINLSVTIPVVIDYIQQIDTIRIGSIQTSISTQFVIPIEIIALDSISSIELPLQFDKSAFLIDSAIFNSNVTQLGTTSIDQPDSGIAIINFQTISNSLSSGNHQLCELYMTSKSQPGKYALDTLTYKNSTVKILRADNKEITPFVEPGSIIIDQPTSVEDESPLLPSKSNLNQNYPNPFNLTTIIEFELKNSGHTELIIYNILGQVVSTLVSNILPAGSHSIAWHGQHDNGRIAATGIYFYRLQTDQESFIRKMALIK